MFRSTYERQVWIAFAKRCVDVRINAMCILCIYLMDNFDERIIETRMKKFHAITDTIRQDIIPCFQVDLSSTWSDLIVWFALNQIRKMNPIQVISMFD